MLYERCFLDALPSLPFADRDQLPREPAVYLVLGGDGAVLYVGRTGNLYYRWVCHQLYDVLVRLPDVHIVWYPCAYSWLDELEWDLMQRFTPPLNRNKRTTLCLGPGLRDPNGGLSLAWWQRLQGAQRWER